MKKLPWSIATVGFLCFLVFIALKRTPENSILSITESKEPFEQIMVLKRDRTYEQLIKFVDETNKEVIIGHTGTWLPTQTVYTGSIWLSKENESSSVFDAGIKPKVKNSIKYNKKLRYYGKGVAFEEVDSEGSATGISAPTPQNLKKWKQWRAQAKPYYSEGAVERARNDPGDAPQPKIQLK